MSEVMSEVMREVMSEVMSGVVSGVVSGVMSGVVSGVSGERSYRQKGFRNEHIRKPCIRMVPCKVYHLFLFLLTFLKYSSMFSSTPLIELYTRFMPSLLMLTLLLLLPVLAPRLKLLFIMLGVRRVTSE